MRIVTSLEQFWQLSREEREKWYIPESLSTQVDIAECGEPLVELTELCQRKDVPIVCVLAGERTDVRVLVRKTVAEKLLGVARKLSEKGCLLKVTDAYRSLALQRTYFEEIKTQIAQREHLQGSELWDRVTQFIADPELCPPHTTGGAVDLTLVHRDTHRELDMGTSVDEMTDSAYTWSCDITDEQRKNRSLLYDAMARHGFVNVVSEWWHYSYGDSYWATFFQQPSALYGSKEII
jgi:D-alanyl-D-alanine dipeptidase